MINTLKMSLKIDMTYAINAFIYTLSRLPILKDLFTEDIYKSHKLKLVVRIIGIVLSTARFILYKLLYFLIIYIISITISNNSTTAFIHIYFVFMILGMFINNKLLNTSTKKYFCIVLFGMDSKSYMKSYLWWNIMLSLLLNGLGFFVFSFFLDYSISICILLIILNIFIRIIGETLNIKFYQKFGYVWLNNPTLYFIVLVPFIILTILPYFDYYIKTPVIVGTSIVLFILSFISYYYLDKVRDYHLIFKKINTKNRVMNSNQDKAYSRQAMVEVKDKDKNIKSKKIQGKKGYDLFHTIFFERHKEILLRSVRIYSVIIAIIYLVLIFLTLVLPPFSGEMHSFLLTNLGWFVIIMYFINRGAIITQAMFYNCDHAMLSYNFYREPKVLLGLFKRRLLSVIKSNLPPAIVIAIGNTLLLFLSGGSSIFHYITLFLFIIVLSIFFSVHYLVLYYLLQPYNKDMEIKKLSYSIASMVTYFMCYGLSDVVMSSFAFSILGLSFTIVYIILALILVYKKAPETFKIA